MSPTSRAAKAKLVARLQRAVSHASAPPVEDWEAQCGGILAFSRRCTATAELGPNASQPPSGFVARPPSTAPKHLMRNLWHAIEPEFPAEGVASVSQDRRRGAGSTQLNFAAVMAPCAWGAHTALICDAPLPYGDGDGERAVPRWCVEGLAALKGHAFPQTTRCNFFGMQ